MRVGSKCGVRRHRGRALNVCVCVCVERCDAQVLLVTADPQRRCDPTPGEVRPALYILRLLVIFLAVKSAIASK